jgi:hypothetical protein
MTCRPDPQPDGTAGLASSVVSCGSVLGAPHGDSLDACSA